MNLRRRLTTWSSTWSQTWLWHSLPLWLLRRIEIIPAVLQLSNAVLAMNGLTSELQVVPPVGNPCFIYVFHSLQNHRPELIVEGNRSRPFSVLISTPKPKNFARLGPLTFVAVEFVKKFRDWWWLLFWLDHDGVCIEFSKSQSILF